MNNLINLVGNLSLLGASELSGIAAAIVFAVVGIGCAIAMGISIFKSADAISRQPSAEKKIRATLMIGLAFIETLAIYALLIAIMLLIL